MSSKYVYTEEFVFLYGKAGDPEREFIHQDPETVKKYLGIMPVYIKCVPLTKHPYVKGTVVKSTPIKKMFLGFGYMDVVTESGTQYRLIME